MIARTILIKKEIAQAIKIICNIDDSPLPVWKNIRFIDSPTEISDYENISVVISTNDSSSYKEIAHGTYLSEVPVNVDVFIPNDPKKNDRLIELIAAAILKDRTLNGKAIDIKLLDTEAKTLVGAENTQVLMFQFEVQFYLRAQNAS